MATARRASAGMTGLQPLIFAYDKHCRMHYNRIK